MSFYEKLGIDKEASVSEIVKAFKRKALLTHPDKHGSKADFQQILRIKNILINNQLRRIYDEFNDGE